MFLNIFFSVKKNVALYYNIYYLCIMIRKIKTYGGYYEAFRETLTEREQDKIDYCLLLLKTQDRIPVSS